MSHSIFSSVVSFLIKKFIKSNMKAENTAIDTISVASLYLLFKSYSEWVHSNYTKNCASLLRQVLLFGPDR